MKSLKDWRREQRKEVLLGLGENNQEDNRSRMAELKRTISSGSRILIVGASGTHALSLSSPTLSLLVVESRFLRGALLLIPISRLESLDIRHFVCDAKTTVVSPYNSLKIGEQAIPKLGKVNGSTPLYIDDQQALQLHIPRFCILTSYQ
jgi:hypothetical protein